MEIIKKLLLFLPILTILGCAPLEVDLKALEPDIVIKNDSFNESIVIESTTKGWCHSPDLGHAIYVKFGYEWNTNYPDDVVIKLESADISNFLDFDVKINGTKYHYVPGKTYTEVGDYIQYFGYQKSSRSRVVMPLNVLRSMVAAEKVLLRINKSEGYQDCNYAIEEKSYEGKTYKFTRYFAREFLAEIDIMIASKG